MFTVETDPPRLSLAGKPVDLHSYVQGSTDTPEICANLDLDRLRGVPARNWLPGLHIHLLIPESDAVVGAYSYYLTWCEKTSKIEFSVSFGREDGVWREHVATAAIYQRLLSTVEPTSEISFSFDQDHASLYSSCTLDATSNRDLHEFVSATLERLCAYISAAEAGLFGFAWTEELLTQEPAFTKKIVVPILRRLGYNAVRYNHGSSEFGKDVLFSDIDRFGNHRQFAAQVKVGDISLSRRNDLDMLISQIDDAFVVGVEGIEEARRHRICELYVITNGAITEHAVQVIRSKVNPRVAANLFFLDRTDIEFWARKLWPLV